MTSSSWKKPNIRRIASIWSLVTLRVGDVASSRVASSQSRLGPIEAATAKRAVLRKVLRLMSACPSWSTVSRVSGIEGV
jgi:hypothetical protein